tara:strand:+ start:168 stop:395 length:228 start_codon:yes stop_codon:yes gene_type:complete
MSLYGQQVYWTQDDARELYDALYATGAEGTMRIVERWRREMWDHVVQNEGYYDYMRNLAYRRSKAPLWRIILGLY